MLSCINQILDFFIKLSIISGIVILCYYYWKIGGLNGEIERLNRNFEKKRVEIRSQPITMSSIDGQTQSEKRKIDEAIAPLERERQRLLSKIPFLK